MQFLAERQFDWGDWVYGLWVAVVGGGSNAVTAGIGLIVIDPGDFNLHKAKFWTMVAGLFTVSAVKDFFLYLSHNPAPKFTTRSTTTATVTGTGAGSVVRMTNTEETSMPAPVNQGGGKA